MSEYTLADMARDAYANAKAKGFHDEQRNYRTARMLIICEIAEAAEEVRRPGFDPREKRYREDGKPEGFGPELADVVIRCGDTEAADCESQGLKFPTYLDTGSAPPGIAVLVVLVNDYLSALDLVVRETYQSLPNTIASCFALAEAVGIDLWADIREKMKYNTTRPRKHGKRL